MEVFLLALFNYSSPNSPILMVRQHFWIYSTLISCVEAIRVGWEGKLVWIQGGVQGSRYIL